MRFNSTLYQTTAQLVGQLPKGRSKALGALFSLWNSHPSWDPWLLKDGNIYRLFYLLGSSKSGPWWMEGKICGAISQDLERWEDLGIVLDVNPGSSWEAGRMLAGCALKENNIYYLFYSAAGEGAEIMNEGIGLATSVDRINWQRSPKQLIKPDASCRWYGQYKRSLGDCDYDHYQWRDPYVVKDEKTKRYYMFICAYLKEGGQGSYRGCVAVAVADHIDGQYELLPPAATPKVEGTQESPFYEMERPQVIYRNGQYHLFFSCWTTWLNPKWLQSVDRSQITDSSLYWYVADQITGPYKPVSQTPVVSSSQRSGIYGTNFFPAPDNPEEFIAYGWYCRRMTLAISPFVRVDWSNDSIQLLTLPR